MNRKLAYICSPFKGDIQNNKEKAKEISIEAAKMGFLPLCVHSFLETHTGLNEETNRDLILELGRDYLRKCDLIIVNIEASISGGMKQEIELAIEMKMDIRTFFGGRIRWK